VTSYPECLDQITAWLGPNSWAKARFDRASCRLYGFPVQG